ncbi:hypothetical protein ATB93_11160 [Sphingomonas sp. WG]|nr:hypothetical protein ATB93_11160 [Sphingomonas sp. WG]
MLVGIEAYHALARRDLDRDDLFREPSLGDGAGGAAMPLGGERVLRRAVNAVPRGDVFCGDAHMKPVDRIGQRLGQRVVHRHRPHLLAEACGVHVVRCLAHVLRPAGDRECGIAEQDHLACGNDRLHPRSAEPVEGERRRSDEDTCRQRGDAREIGVLRSCGDHLAHHHMVDLCKCDSGATHCFRDHDPPELRCGHVLQRPAKVSDSGANSGQDHYCIAHPVLR